MILNQTRTGKPCRLEIMQLASALPPGNESFMCYVKVHAFTLATVLDRLEALEDFQTRALGLSASLSNHISVD